VAEEVRLVLPEEEIENWGDGLRSWAANNGIISLLAPTEEESSGPLPVLVTNPRPNEEIQGSYPIRGAARSDDFIRYVVEWGRGSAPDSWVQINSSTRQLLAGPLAIWNTAFVPNGEYTIRVLMEDAKLGTRQYSVHVVVNNGDEAVQDDLAPVVQLISPLTESAVSGAVQITGTAGAFDLEEFVVEIGAGLTPSEWTPIERRTTSVANNRLATWDTTSVGNGIYSIRVTVRDSIFGEAQAQIFVVVRNGDGG
jgi:hypothetical protein